MRKKPHVLSTTTVARSRLFRVENLHLRFSNGREVDYERLTGNAGGAVLVVPVLDAQTLLLVREYAAGTERYELGFPKGRVERGESPSEAANRELREETGYGSNMLSHMRSMTLAPGYMGHTTHSFLARELHLQPLPGDEPEDIEVVPWSLNRIEALLDCSDFTEARSIAALSLALTRLGRPGHALR